MSFIFKCDVQSGIDVILTCFCFTILVTRLCRAIMAIADMYANLCSFNLGRYDVVQFVERDAASGIFSVFYG